MSWDISKAVKKINYFFFPGQIPLQYASIEKDVAACEKVERSVLPSAPAEFKPSSDSRLPRYKRQQVTTLQLLTKMKSCNARMGR